MVKMIPNETDEELEEKNKKKDKTKLKKPVVKKPAKKEEIKKDAQLTQEDLNALEKEAVVNLTKGLANERDNTAWVRLALDFLKAKHPSYRDKKDQILPQEYKQLWEEVTKNE
jgi:hypothetical protein